jgi:threonine aldolase
LAAAGIYALDNNIDRLSQDHNRAREIASAVSDMDSYTVNLNQVQTNMVYVGCEEGDSENLVRRLEDRGIKTLTIDHSTIRIVTHLHITDNDVQKTIEALESAQT